MGNKKLNLNQPFLSVRRNVSTTVTTSRVSKEERKTHYPSRPVTHHLPPHKSDLKSGPVSNPGAVPFQWEHTPGQPKNQDTIKSPTDKNTEITIMPPVTAPKLHPGNSALEVVPRGPSHDEQIEKETKEESLASGDNEAYVDCRTSGLSGPGDDLFAKTPLTGREFMMDRFLPAAKAMASPHYVNKKQKYVVEERSEKIKKNVRDQCKPQLRYGPSFAKRYSDYIENEDESDNDDDDDEYEYDQSRNLPGVCGLLPRFCLSLSNPVPAMSVRAHLTNVQPRFSLADSSTEIRNEVTMVERTEQKSVDKLQIDELDDDDKKKSRRNECDTAKGLGSDAKEFKTFEEFIRTEPNSASPVAEKTLYVDTIHKSNSAHEIDAFSVYCSIDKSIGKRWLPEKKATEGSLVNYARHLVPPPLPKSPSDSWLGRTLPSMPNKKSYLRLYPSPRNELSKKTTVKTTKVQQRHMHYSEESLTTIPEA